MNPIFDKHFVPLTKGDSREAAGGQGLSHFYHGLLAFRILSGFFGQPVLGEVVIDNAPKARRSE